MTTYSPRGYEAIKTLAQDEGLTIPDLLAMARNNDPFFCGSPAQEDKARWFVELWQRFGYTTGVHLRRVHYRLVSQHAPTMHDGQPYENTERCWSYLCEAGKFARILGLVSAEAFEDHRNPDPHILVSARDEEPTPEFTLYDPELHLPSIDVDLGVDFYLPAPSVFGYDYSPADQPYHLELWVEKSTMDDVLTPICEEIGANLVTSLGFQSITSVVTLLKRLAVYDKPARIFYISDFDPAGDGMPSAVARQIEFWLQDFAPGADVKLTPLVLTRAQVIQYRLPRIPIKDTDKRRGGFEDRHGEGAVELDALEALYPGELAGIVRRALVPYRDPDLAGELRATARAALATVYTAWRAEIEAERSALALLQDDALAIAERYREDLERLSAALESDLDPVRAQVDAIRQAIQDKLEDFEPDLLDRPEPVTDEPDESGWLFDAGRDYLDQLEVYQARKASGVNGYEQGDAI